MDPLDRLQRSQDAQGLLGNYLFREFLDSEKAKALNTIVSSPIGDLTATAACATLKVIHNLEEYLKGVVNDEAVAEQLKSRTKHRPF